MTRPRSAEFTAKTKDQAAIRAKDHCELCGLPFGGARPEFDHRLPVALGGDNSIANCMCLCKACHKAKTAKEDVPRIRKADRQRRASVGAVRDKHAIPARAKPPKVVKDKLPLPERRGIYVWEE